MAGEPHLCLPLCALLQRENNDNFIICDGRHTSSWTFAHRVAGLSHGLRTRLAIPVGTVVLVASLNTDHMLIALLAICDAGCLATPINHRWSASELAGAMRVSRPACILVDNHCSNLVHAAISTLKNSNEPIPAYIGLEPTRATDGVDSKPDDCTLRVDSLADDYGPTGHKHLQLLAPISGAAMLCFTSGTTGQPKAVVLTHTCFHTQSMAKLAVVGYNANDTYLHLAPLFHIGGLSSAFACIMAGASHVLVPRFTADQAIQSIRQHHVTSFIAVPAIMQDIITHAQQQQQPIPKPMTSVRCILMGGGVTPATLQDAMCQIFPCACVLSAYGMTEACSSITFHTLRRSSGTMTSRHSKDHSSHTGNSGPQQSHQHAAPAQSQWQSHLQGSANAGIWAGGACAGWPAPGVAVRVMPLDDQHGGDKPCASSSGQHLIEGEVWTKGPHTFHSYFGNHEETVKVYTADGWMRTGDMGFFAPDGSLWLKGRAKDMIKSGGENVYAVEVEAALCSHPGVSAAAVVGVPHTRWSESVAAAVVLKPGWSWLGDLTLDGSHWQAASTLKQQGVNSMEGVAQQAVGLEALCAHCRHVALLSPYKVPRVIAAVVDRNVTTCEAGSAPGHLPVNASGKVIKTMVRDAMIRVMATSEQTNTHSKL